MDKQGFRDSTRASDGQTYGGRSRAWSRLVRAARLERRLRVSLTRRPGRPARGGGPRAARDVRVHARPRQRVRATLERAHHAHLEAGTTCGSAGAFWVGINLALRGEMGPAGGWLGRAQRILGQTRTRSSAGTCSCRSSSNTKPVVTLQPPQTSQQTPLPSPIASGTKRGSRSRSWRRAKCGSRPAASRTALPSWTRRW